MVTGGGLERQAGRSHYGVDFATFQIENEEIQGQWQEELGGGKVSAHGLGQSGCSSMDKIPVFK